MSKTNLAHQILGRYQLLVAIARGGMGQVWLARLQGARGFHKLVAIKTLLPDRDEGGRLERMLLEEARIAALIHHPNVVQTLELGEHEGTLYLAMEWVDGEPLGFVMKRAVERGGMSHGVAAALMSQVLAGLHAAHELSDESGPLGVVHRDVTPHNILVTFQGVAKLLDFGIAKATKQSSSNTESGEVKGKFSYMAPEQILGGEVDRRCDVFAVGIVLYLLTTGRHPFRNHSTAGVIHSITSEKAVAPPSEVMPDYPPALEAVVMKALAKDPAQRWESAEEMRLALEQALPAAFSGAGKAELKEFTIRVLADRQLARQEAIRRAQVSADARDVQTGPRPPLQSPTAQSASSLRAISISQPAPDEKPLLPTLRPSEPDAGPPREKRKLSWVAAGALGLVLALALPVSRSFRASAGPVKAASHGIEAGVPLSAPSAAASPPAPASATSSQRTVTLAVAPSTSAETPAAAISGANPRPRNVPGQPAAVAPTKPKKSGSSPQTPPASSIDDLIAPDYAR